MARPVRPDQDDDGHQGGIKVVHGFTASTW